MRFAFWLGVFLIVALPTSFALLQEPKASIILVLIAPGAAVSVLAKLDLVSEFSLGPIKARMKETITDAQDAIKEIKKLAVALAEPQLTQLMAGNFGFQDGSDFFRRQELAEGICESLRQLDVDEVDIEAARKEWNNGMTQIFANEVQHRFERRIRPNTVNFNEPERREVGERFQDFVAFKDGWKAPSPKEMIDFFARNGFSELEDSVLEVPKAYEAFEKTRRIENPKQLFTHLSYEDQNPARSR